MEMIQPKAIITLKVADDRDKKMFVVEDHDTVCLMINLAKKDDLMVTVTRWRAMETSPYSTQPTNIVNVEPNI